MGKSKQKDPIFMITLVFFFKPVLLASKTALRFYIMHMTIDPHALNPHTIPSIAFLQLKQWPLAMLSYISSVLAT